MPVTLIHREPVSVAYLRHTGPYGPGIGQFWMQRVAPWMVDNYFHGRERFGISLDDPRLTPGPRCRYDACVASPEDEEVRGDHQRQVIPGGHYAALDFEGTGAEIPAAWDRLVHEWLPASGWRLDDRPLFEYYPVGGFYDLATGAFTCTLCLPVAPAEPARTI